MNISVILPAAGLGSRFAAGENASGSKIEFELGHKPVFLRTIELFHGLADVVQIILAVSPAKLDDFKFRWADRLAFQGVELVAGGEAERWETVRIALAHVSDDATHVAVHDAARPCASLEMIERVFAAADKHGAALPGIAMGDTVKRVLGVGGWGSGQGDPLDDLFGVAGDSAQVVGKVCETVDRAGLYRVQTPQVFEKGLLVEAYGQLNAATAEGITDDASVMELAGHDVFIVQGDPLNMKLTHPEDVELMEAVLKMRSERDAKSAAEKALFGDDED